MNEDKQKPDLQGFAESDKQGCAGNPSVKMRIA
jgi:hypothetical protein